jgi:hypothetical protein
MFFTSDTRYFNLGCVAHHARKPRHWKPRAAAPGAVLARCPPRDLHPQRESTNRGSDTRTRVHEQGQCSNRRCNHCGCIRVTTRAGINQARPRMRARAPGVFPVSERAESSRAFPETRSSQTPTAHRRPREVRRARMDLRHAHSPSSRRAGSHPPSAPVFDSHSSPKNSEVKPQPRAYRAGVMVPREGFSCR